MAGNCYNLNQHFICSRLIKGKKGYYDCEYTHISWDMDAGNISCLHEKHVVLERISTRIRKHAISH